MDNITHSLLGLVIGESFAKRLNKSRGAILSTSVLANNFPDLDFLYAAQLSSPFGSLLHHRGHTHTILGALGCGTLVWLLVWTVLTARSKGVDKETSWRLFFIANIGTLVHILLDSLNTYGVHPFWPIENRWHYGDTLFIIEPTLWIALSLALLPAARNRFTRFFFTLLPIFSFALIFLSGFVPVVVGGGIFLLVAISVLIARKMLPQTRARIWYTVSLSFFSSFLLLGSLAARSLPLPAKDETLLANFVLPHPANPFCWGSMQMRLTSEELIYERGTIQPLKDWFTLPCEEYSLFHRGRGTSSTKDEERAPRSEFIKLKDNCRWRAFLQFSRVPMMTPCENAPGLCSNDLRFRRFGKKGFTSIPLDGDCPSSLPPWISPADSLLTLHETPTIK